MMLLHIIGANTDRELYSPNLLKNKNISIFVLHETSLWADLSKAIVEWLVVSVLGK